MQMNPNIILAGQTPDVAGAAIDGVVLASGINDVRRTNALRDLYQQQGAGIMAGDQGALNALAGFDPAVALDIQSTRQDMTFAANQEDRAAQEFKMALDQMSQAEAAAEAEKIRAAIGKAAAAQTPEQWDAYVMSIGKPELAGQFANRETILLQYMDLTDYIETEKGLKDLRGGDQYTQVPGSQLGMTGEQAGALFNVGPDGKVSAIGDGGVIVNTGDQGARMGTIPQGYAAVEDPQSPAGYRMVPIPGGPEDTTQFDANARAGQERSANIVLEDINNVLGALDSGVIPKTGVGGAVFSQVPGTGAFDIARTLDTIKANVGFDKLQQMRDASPTGGALGQVSEQENKLLQSVLGNLEQSQSEAQFRSNLERLKRVYLDIIHGPGNWGDGQATGTTQNNAPQVGVTEDGYRFLGGDPADPKNWEKVDQ